MPPPVTPALETDKIELRNVSGTRRQGASSLCLEIISADHTGEAEIEVKGQITGVSDNLLSFEAFVNELAVPKLKLQTQNDSWTLRTTYKPFEPPSPPCGGVGEVVKNALVVCLVKATSGVKGKMILIKQQATIET